MEPFSSSCRLYKRAAVGEGRKKAWGVWQHCWHGYCTRRDATVSAGICLPTFPLNWYGASYCVSMLSSRGPVQVMDDEAVCSPLVMHYALFCFLCFQVEQERRCGCGPMAEYHFCRKKKPSLIPGISKQKD